MRIFYRRPLALVCAAFIAGSAIAFFFNLNAKIAMAVALAAIAVLAFSLLLAVNVKHPRRERRWRRLLCIVLSLLMAVGTAIAVSSAYFDGKYMPRQYYIGQQLNVRGVVLSNTYSNNFSEGFEVLVTHINGAEERFEARLDCEYVSDMKPGFEFEAIVTAAELGYSEYDSSDRLSSIADGALLRLISSEEESCTVLRENVFRPDIWAAKLNNYLTFNLELAVDGEEGRLISALLLGRKDRISYETERDFRRSGVSHILALSGMHMTIIMGFLDLILRRLGVPRRVRCVLLIFEMSFYLLLTGFSISAVRAAIMLGAVYISFLFREGKDSITSLFASGALILAVSPASVADVGFWLSLCATLAIIVTAEFNNAIYRRLYRGGDIKAKKLKRLFAKVLSAIIGICISTVAASAATMLIVCLFFGEYSLASILGNLFLSSLATLLLALSLALVLLLPLPFLVAFFAPAARWIASFMLKISGFISQIDGCVISLRYGFALVIIFFMTLSIAVLLTISIKKKWMISFPVAAAVVSFAVCLGLHTVININTLPVEYICADGGEMIAAAYAGKGIVIDISDGSYSKMRLAADAVREGAATEFEAVIITHYHNRHISSLSRFVSSECVESVYLPSPQNENEFEVCQSIVSALQDSGTDIKIYSSGQMLNMKRGLKIELSHGYIDRSAHPVITAQISYGDKEISYIGSSVHEGELGDIRIGEYVIFGSHGPKLKSAFEYNVFGAEKLLFADVSYLAAFSSLEEVPDGIRIICFAERHSFTIKK